MIQVKNSLKKMKVGLAGLRTNRELEILKR